MAGLVEDVAELLDLAAGERFERAEQTAGKPDGIGDIAHDELAGIVAAVHQAVEFLSVAAGRERHARCLLARIMNARGDRKKFGVALHGAKFTRHAGNALRAVAHRFGQQPLLRFVPAFADDLGDLRHLAADDVLKSGRDAAQEAQRMDGVADHQFAGLKALLRQAIHFVARQSGHDRHWKYLLKRQFFGL